MAGNNTVMVVDDERSVRLFLSKLLREINCTVIEANSGWKCLELLSKETPDLIIMDQMMPKMTGLETVEKIRKNSATEDLEIIFLSVVPVNDLGREVLADLQVLSYIEKPFETAEFRARVRAALGLEEA